MSGVELAIAASVASTALSFASGMQQASAAKAQGRGIQQQREYEAKVNEVQAGQERAAFQRSAINQRRQAQLVEEKAIAIGAAQGGSVDPSTLNIISDIAQEGDYRVATSLYDGEERARALESSAQIARYEGDAAARAGRSSARSQRFSAFANLAGDAVSFAGKYGDSFGSNRSGLDPNVDYSNKPTKKPTRLG